MHTYADIAVIGVVFTLFAVLAIIVADMLS